MSRRASAALLLVVVGVFTDRSARAEESRPAVTFDVEPSISGCPGAPAFESTIRGLLGERGIPEDVAVTVHVRRAPKELSADLEVRLRDAVVGKRELRAPRHACGDLASATALAASLLVEEQTKREDLTPPPVLVAPEARSSSDPVPTRPAPEAPRSRQLEHSTAARARLRGSSWAGVELDWNALPHAGVGIVAGFSFGTANVHGFVEGASLFPSEVQSPLGAVMRVGLQMLRVGPCARYRANERAIVIGCVSGNFGSLLGQGASRIANPREFRFFAAEVGARIGVSVPVVGPFAARLDARAAVALTSAEFTLGDLGFQTPPWSLSLAALCETHF